MKRRSAVAEAVLLGAVGAALLALAASGAHVELLEAIHPWHRWAERRELLGMALAVAGGISVVAALGSVMLQRSRGVSLAGLAGQGVRALASEARDTGHWFADATNLRRDATWLVLITGIGAAVRFYYLSQPVRYDEAMTFFGFVNQGFFNQFHYGAPNNHVLHTILARASLGLFGNSPAALRLPAAIAGVLAIPMTFGVTRLLTGNRVSGYVAAAFMAVLPYLVLYDTMARGYSLLVLLSLCLAALVFRLLSDASLPLVVLAAAVAAAGVLAIPTFVFAATGLYLWAAVVLVSRRGLNESVRILAALGLATTVATCLAYAPVILTTGGVGPIVANQYVVGLPWADFFSRLPAHIAATATGFARDLPATVAVAIAILACVGPYMLVRQGRRDAALLFPALALGAGTVLVLKHAIPFSRNWIYGIPFVLMAADAGLGVLPERGRRALRHVAAGAAALAGMMLVSSSLVTSYGAAGQFPEAPVVARVLDEWMEPGDRVEFGVPTDYTTRYYMALENAGREPDAVDTAAANAPPKQFLVVQPSRYSVGDLTDRHTRLLLRIRDAEIHVVEDSAPSAALPVGADLGASRNQ